MNEDLGKIPPQALEVEEVILGALLIDKNVIAVVAQKLMVNSFYKDHHQRIYNACLDLWNSGNPIDILTVINQLKSTGELESIGGAYAISKLTERINSSSNLEYHIAIVRQKAVARDIIKITSEALNESYEDSTDITEVLHDLLQSLGDVNKYISSLGTRGTSEHAKELLKELKEVKENKNKMVGIDTGFKELNKKLSGYQRSDLIIEAGRPGMGKTAKMISSVRAQLALGLSVAIFSLEMKGSQLILRLVAQDLDISFTKIRNMWLNDECTEQVYMRIEWYEQTKLLFIEDKASIKPIQIKGKLLNFKADIVYIDYLQLMKGNDKKYSNTESEVSDVSRCLKEIAKDLDLPVVALAQLSRQVESRGGNKIPNLSDLRGSGSIEQDADVVIFIYRPGYYGFEDENIREGESNFIVEKQRNGSVGICSVEFVKETMKYQDFEDEQILHPIPDF